MDVAVTCPMSSSNLSRDSPAEYCAAHLKHLKYDKDFVGTNFDFSALIFESTGAVNREGSEFLSQLFRFAARYSGTAFSVYAGRAWARLSCTLQSAVAQSIINRAPGFDQSSSHTSEDSSTIRPLSLNSGTVHTSSSSVVQPCISVVNPSLEQVVNPLNLVPHDRSVLLVLSVSLSVGLLFSVF